MMPTLMNNSAGNYYRNVSSANAPFGIQIIHLLGQEESKCILCLIAYNTVIIYYLCDWITSTNSIALTAYVNTVLFNILSLLVCLLSLWVSRNSKYAERQNDKGNGLFGSSSGYFSSNYVIKEVEDGCRERGVSLSCLGPQKYEVLAILVSSCLILAIGSLISVNMVLRLSDQPIIHTGKLGVGGVLGFVAHMGTTFVYPDAGLNPVLSMALPCSNFFKKFNLILFGNILSAVILYSVHLIIHIWELHAADTAAAFALIGLTATSMLPLAFYTSSVIFQKVPHRITEQLDRCLREALSIDGVVEFRNERLWMKSFGKLAGRVEVRVRKDANENYVLENVMKHLSRMISSLEIVEFRDSWINSSDNFLNYNTPEYYIDELLGLPCTRELNTSNKKICDEVRIMKIDDILATDENTTFTNIKSSKIVNNQIFQKNNYQISNYLYNVKNINNALITGARFSPNNHDTYFMNLLHH